MSTYNLFTRRGNDAYSYPAKVAGVYAVNATLDFSSPLINSGAGTVQNDIVQLIEVPANTLVLAVFSKVVTLSTITDFDIGDGDDVDGYIDGASMAVAGVDACSWVGATTVGTPNALPVGAAFCLGKFYTAADTIDLKQNTNLTVVAGVLKVKALMIDLNIYD